MLKATINPGRLYLVSDTDGSYHWYDRDPIHLDEVERKEIEINLEQRLTEIYGTGTPENPLSVVMDGSILVRCEPFTMREASMIVNGQTDKQIEDRYGNSVILSSSPSKDKDYPIIGTVFDKDGMMLGKRLYDLSGRCKDLIHMHGLIILFKETSESIRVSERNMEKRASSGLTR